MKIDHALQSYNDVDCKTCKVTLISDTSNIVVEKNGVPVPTPYPAVFVGSNLPYFIHNAWTAEDDPTLATAGAEWIWEFDPTRDEDTRTDVTYTFRKTFVWMGPIVGSDLWFAVGSDNSVEVWLNGVKIGENTGEYGYRQESMLHIPGAMITSNVIQGTNILEFKVKNWALSDGDYTKNPGGLIYKFEIDGKCGDDFFKTHCKLWGEKDLTEGDIVWNFDDVKPGDYGRDVISLHVFNNDAWACTTVNGQDLENVRINPEIIAGDLTDNIGELSGNLKLFAWWDINNDGLYNPGEPTLYDGSMGPSFQIPLAEGGGTPIPGNATKYIGFAWCFGDQIVNTSTGVITCDGKPVDNKSQTDSYNADISFYAVQSRNNANFTCSSIVPTPTPD